MIRAFKSFYKKSYRFYVIANQTMLSSENLTDFEYKYITYSLISEIWKAWCLFCREIIFLSCSGTTTRNGIVVPARSSRDNAIQRIAYEANQARRGSRVHPNKRCTFIRQEPTWGDQNLLVTIIPSLSPSNAVTLQSGFGSVSTVPQHLQIIRNYFAHSNSETALELKQVSKYYKAASDITDVLSWVNPHNSSTAIFYWLSELEEIAKVVTE